MNPIDTSQLNNSNRKTWHWSIRYGIEQLNSPIDQSLVLMVTMKLSVHQLNGVNRHQVSRLERGAVLVNFVGFGNRFLFIVFRSGRKAGSYLLG
jgi:hypothetical protein